VHGNVDNATVYFDAEVKGQISQGILEVPVNVSGAPYRAFSVSKEGYIPYGAPITEYPAAGERVDLSATLKPAPSATLAAMAPTTKAPFPPEIVVFAILIGSLACMATGGKKP
jgi:hypothetical protein